jgi:hypothetical protein
MIPMTQTTFTYEAKHDTVGAFVPLQNRRRHLVVKYRDGKFAFVCGAFSTPAAAAKRAAYLNEHHLSAFLPRVEG